jgi:hypothetical protein
MIVLMVAAGMLLWASPVIEGLRYDAYYRDTLYSFKNMDTVFDDCVQEGTNSSRTTYILVRGGSLNYEVCFVRWIVYYGFEDSAVVSYRGLDAADYFVVDTTVDQINVTVEWLEDGAVELLTAISPGSRVDPARNISGSVKISVADAADNSTLSECWLFDLSALAYRLSTPQGLYEIKYVNCAVLTKYGMGRQVATAPLLLTADNTIVHFVTNVSAKGLVGCGGGEFRMSFLNKATTLRAATRARNLTLQLFGDTAWQDAWYGYFTTYEKFFERTYDNEKVLQYRREYVELRLVQASMETYLAAV